MAKWLQKAIKHPGRVKRALGVKKGESIPSNKSGALHKLAKKKGGLGAAARLAERLRSGIRKKK